jgi:hypothetical protein
MSTNQSKSAEGCPSHLKTAKEHLEAVKKDIQTAHSIAVAAMTPPDRPLIYPVSVYKHYCDMRDMNNLLVTALNNLALAETTLNAVTKQFGNMENILGQLSTRNKDLKGELAGMRLERQALVDLAAEWNAKIKDFAEEREE